MAEKQKVKFKVLKQSADVGGKFYGVINNADPFVPAVTMQQIIDYKKLHSYSASQLAALIEDVLQGAAELVARDGLPRNLSSLLKFEARIKGTFANSEASVTTQKVYVSPRMLKDIKTDLNKADFEFTNTNDNTAPVIRQAAQEFVGFETWSVADVFVNIESAGWSFKGPLVLSGDRLCPNGWTADCSSSVVVNRKQDGVMRYLCDIQKQRGSLDDAPGILSHTPTVASVNALKFLQGTSVALMSHNAWQEGGASYDWVPAEGDEIVFIFSRELTDGSGSRVEATKKVTLVA